MSGKWLRCLLLGHYWTDWHPLVWTTQSTNAGDLPDQYTTNAKRARVCLRGDHIQFRFWI